MSPRRRRVTERGLFRGCCLGLVLLGVVLGFGAWCADRAIAAPQLGTPPGGADDGASEVQIALTLAAHLAPQLATTPHGAVTLSEHDLTVLAQQHNPHPDRYSNLAVRVRDRLLVISANDHYGPFTVTPVLRMLPQLRQSTEEVLLQVQRLDVGELTLPGYVRDAFLGQLPSVVSIPSLFGANGTLKALSQTLECIAVTAKGLVIGVHRPGASSDPSTCGAAQP